MVLLDILSGLIVIVTIIFTMIIAKYGPDRTCSEKFPEVSWDAELANKKSVYFFGRCLDRDVPSEAFVNTPNL